jgi:hypothetical protein
MGPTKVAGPMTRSGVIRRLSAYVRRVTSAIALRVKRTRSAAIMVTVHSIAVPTYLTSAPNFPTTLQAVRPTPGAVIDAQNLDGSAVHAVGNDIGRLWNDEFARSGYAAWTPHVRVVRQ